MKMDNNRPITPRVSKFTEGTMNSTSSIHPPPDTLWMELGIEEIINKVNEESSFSGYEAETTREKAAPFQPTAAPVSEGIFSRFSRAATSLFRGTGFSGLGKRKEREGEEKKDSRKEEVERAYAEAKALGLLPAPKTFNRPHARPRPTTAASSRASSSTPRDPSAPTPALRSTPSKKDLHKQLKLSKRVSDLEFKLAKARKELSETLGDPIPPVPAVPAAQQTPATLPPTPAASTSHSFSQDELSPHLYTSDAARKSEDLTPSHKFSNVGKITKKRKAIGNSDDDYKPIPTDTESDYGSDRGSKKSKSTSTTKAAIATTNTNAKVNKRQRKGSRLTKKRSNIMQEKVVIVVPDGAAVPPVPSIPNGMEGKRAAVSDDDGFGGLGHEIF